MMVKVLVVEDDIQELEYVKALIGKDNRAIEVYYANTLTDALKVLNEQNVDVVVTDVFYPTGQKPKSKRFFTILAMGLLYANNAVFSGMKEVLKYEIQKYMVELATGNVAEDEVPSGVVLGLYALCRGKLPIFVSSLEHHAAKTNALIALCRLGGGIFFEECFKEGINKETGRKNWEKALKHLPNSSKEKVEDQPEIPEIMTKAKGGKYGVEVAELMRLPENLHNYFDF